MLQKVTDCALWHMNYVNKKAVVDMSSAINIDDAIRDESVLIILRIVEERHDGMKFLENLGDRRICDERRVIKIIIRQVDDILLAMVRCNIDTILASSICKSVTRWLRRRAKSRNVDMNFWGQGLWGLSSAASLRNVIEVLRSRWPVV